MWTPSMTCRAGSPGPLGQMTLTSYPASRSARHSSQTRRSRGTGRFCTITRTWGLSAAFSAMRPPSERVGGRGPEPDGLPRYRLVAAVALAAEAAHVAVVADDRGTPVGELAAGHVVRRVAPRVAHDLQSLHLTGGAEPEGVAP